MTYGGNIMFTFSVLYRYLFYFWCFFSTWNITEKVLVLILLIFFTKGSIAICQIGPSTKIENPIYTRKFTSQYTKLSHVYGLSKVHKQVVPLRLIASSRNITTTKLILYFVTQGDERPHEVLWWDFVLAEELDEEWTISVHLSNLLETKEHI